MKTKIFALLIIILSFCCFTCQKQEEPVIDLTYLEKTTDITHKWFYFTPSSFSEIQNTTAIPKVFFKPWTESTRVTDGTSYNEKAYFAINKKGLLICDGDELALKTDTKFFDKNTIGTFLIQDGNPILHLYKNDTFNTQPKDFTPVFIYYNPETEIFYPFLSKQNLNISQNAEAISTFLDTEKLYFSVKDSSGLTTEFDFFYLDNSNFSELKFVSQIENNIKFNIESIKSIPENEFLFAIEPLDFEKAPESVKTLLSGIPKSYNFLITIHFEDGSQKKYVQGNKENSNILEANAIISKNYTAALFADGTLYFSGATQNRHFVNGGNTVCLRLPKLQKGYMYTSFAITKNMLYAAFEEYDFYQTGNSGFIQVDLDKTLYKVY